MGIYGAAIKKLQIREGTIDMNRVATLACLIVLVMQGAAAADGTRSIPYARADVLKLAEKVADYQLATMGGGYVPPNTSKDTIDPTGWVQAAFFVGLTALADRSDKPAYSSAIVARGVANQWQLGPRLYHADDHSIGATYLWAAQHAGVESALAPLRERFDRILEYPPSVDLAHADYGDPRGVTCAQRWCWSDAIFMAPPVWFELSLRTADPKYANFAKAELDAVNAYLYDASEHLYFRDSRFFDRRGPNGEKIFWSRGNGWALSGLARSIPLLTENDPARERMESVFKQMAAKLKSIQRQDGFWSPSLLADPQSSVPESSGTGFFVHGLAWGMKAGLLSRSDYEATVRKGWSALTRAVHPTGKVGYVQQVSDRPDNVSFDDTQYYGVGAFLLAATAVADLNLKPAADLTKSQAPRTQAVLNVREGGEMSQGAMQGGTFHRKHAFNVPSEHAIHDGLFAFEGLGWESDLIGYRLYLDERFAVDIFGKKTNSTVLQRIGQKGDDYHELSDWGMDVFKVGETVGLGSVGRIRDGKPAQLQPSKLRVLILEGRAEEAVSEVVASGFNDSDVELTASFSIRQGSPITRVEGRASRPIAELITGITHHPGVRVIHSDRPVNGWAYVATWGKQSLANDDLGLVLFYQPRAVHAGTVVDANGMLYVQFLEADRFDYGFAAAWAQDRQGAVDLTSFQAWLDSRLNDIAARL
jgi:rhamnogalacturonyl hydrolase YesR